MNGCNYVVTGPTLEGEFMLLCTGHGPSEYIMSSNDRSLCVREAVRLFVRDAGGRPWLVPPGFDPGTPPPETPGNDRSDEPAGDVQKP